MKTCIYDLLLRQICKNMIQFYKFELSALYLCLESNFLITTTLSLY